MKKRFLLGGCLAAILLVGAYLSHHQPSPQLDSRPANSPLQVTATSPMSPSNVTQTGTSASVTAGINPNSSAGYNPAREMNPTLNPYAAGLREPGKSKRTWDPAFLNAYDKAVDGDPIQFALTDGKGAVGIIHIAELKDGRISYLSGELTQPERGKFFFVRPPEGGKAGKAVGVIEFSASSVAYRIEPTGVDGAPELWQRRMDEVLCMNMAKAPEAAQAAQASPEVENMPPLRPDLVPNYVPSYNSNIISLQSYPGSQAVLLLDFFGGYTPTWGGVTYPAPNVSNDTIKDIWKRVAEDFMAFNINVTTDIRVYQTAPASSRQRCAFTPGTTNNPLGAGGAGVAYFGSWNWGSDTPCWSGYTSGKAAAEVAAHEPGHTLGLSHDGTDNNGTHVEYYSGQGSGVTGWAPIMGAGYYQSVTTWSKGEYQYANNTQDQIQMIVTQNNNVTYRVDDTGSTLATSRYLEVSNNNAAFAEGVIERAGDTDAFQFTTRGGQISLTANPVGDWANLAIVATLCDSNDTVIATSNPQSTLNASIARSLVAGTYTFRVTGTGRNNPLTDGFTAYASCGYYSISGTVAAPRVPTRFSIPENAPAGLTVGAIPATNPNNDPLTYNILSGNTGGTFTISNGVLVVTDNSLLNYETLAPGTVFPVQFEMLVDIVDTANPSYTEASRRVVVAVTNVNEAPMVSGFAVSVLEHTLPGTFIGAVVASDPDFYTVPSYSFISGNSNAAFAINNQGIISVAADLAATNQSLYKLQVRVSDQTQPSPLMATSMVTVTVVPNQTGYRPGTIAYTVYTNLSGNLVSALTGASVFPYDPAFEIPLTQTEAPSNWGADYGGVMRGYLIPPATGAYTFWIATDDNGELWLSTSANPAGISLRCSITGDGSYAGIREWTKFSSQQSQAVTLTAGVPYYFEARMKQGGGGDNFAVAWQCPQAGITRDVIPGRYIAPYSLNYVPHGIGFTSSVHRDALGSARLGTVGFTDVNTNDGHVFSIAGGNVGSVFSINSSNGIVRVASEAALVAATQTNITLTIRVADTGVPSRSSTVPVKLTIVPATAITATTLQQEIWTNISGTAVSALTASTLYPKRPHALRAFSGFDSGKTEYGDNYGSRVRGLLTPTATGSYTFYFASDDNGQLKLSTTTSPANATVIASVGDSTDYLQWDKFTSQTSAAITLTAGRQYYIEALQKEAGGGDHVEVAWTGPGISAATIIAPGYLKPVDLNSPPELASKILGIPTTTTNGAVVATVTAVDSAIDSITYKIVSGNIGNTFAINPDNGRISVIDNTAILGRWVDSFLLKIQAQDSGYGDLFPRKSTNATITVVLAEPTAVVWSGNGSNNNWSVGQNWSGTVPPNSSPLIFVGSTRQTNINDVLSVAGLVDIQNGGFDISGQPLILRSGLTSSGDNTWRIESSLNKTAAIQNIGGTLYFEGQLLCDVNAVTLGATETMIMDGPISGSGPVTISGPGTVQLAAANPMTGPVTIFSGTLALKTSGAAGSVSAIDVFDGSVLDAASLPGGFTVDTAQTLGGAGVVFGDVTIQGALSPGDPIGTLSFSNNVTLSGTTVIEFSKSDSGLANDMIAAAGSIHFGGLLVLTNSGGPLALGDSLRLFAADKLAGSFSSFDLPLLDSGLTWNFDTLNTDGTVRVTHPGVRISAMPMNTGGGLNLSFQTAPGTTYVIESTEDLTVPIQWTSVSTNVGDGAVLTIPTSMTPQETRRYFRILSY